MTNYLELGQIVNTFGIKGMVKVKPFTDDIEQFEILKNIEIKTKKEIKEYKIEQVKFHKQIVILLLIEITLNHLKKIHIILWI